MDAWCGECSRPGASKRGPSDPEGPHLGGRVWGLVFGIEGVDVDQAVAFAVLDLGI